MNIKDIQRMAPANTTSQSSGGLNIKDIQRMAPISQKTTPISLGSIGKSVYDFFTGASQKFGEMIGNSIAAPENVQKYSDALNQHNEITQNVLKAIQQKKSMGQDTSKLEEALKEQMTSTPQLKDFVDPATLQRLHESFGQNLEETLGLAGGTALEALGGGVLESGAKTAGEAGATLGSKILQGMKVGGAYGAVGGATGALANKEDLGGVLGETVKGAAIGAGTGGALEFAGGAISNKIKGRPVFGSLAKVPSKLTGEEGALLNTPEAKQIILDTQSMIKDSIKNSDLPTASKVLGSKKLGSILDKTNTMLKSIGDRMGAVLKDPKIGGSATDISSIEKNFSSDLGSRVAVNTNSDKQLLNEFKNDLANISGGDRTVQDSRGFPVTLKGNKSPATLSEVDQFLRKWQPIDASAKMQNNSVGSLIDSTVHDINKEAMSTADKAEGAEPGQGEYSKTNQEYADLVEDRNDAEKSAGTQRSTGIYDNADSIIKKASNPSTADEAWRNLANKTGIPLGQPAALMTTIEKIYNGEKIDDVLKTLQIGFSLKWTAIRTLKNILVKSEGDPNAIVQKMIQFIDDSSSIPASSVKVPPKSFKLSKGVI